MAVADKSVIHSQSIQKLSRFLLLIFNKYALIILGAFLLQMYLQKEKTWGFSSAGRAPALQAGGQRFDPANLHQPVRVIFLFRAKARQNGFIAQLVRAHA